MLEDYYQESELEALGGFMPRSDNNRLSNLEPGLIKINYSFNNSPKEELALITSQDLGYLAGLPNNAFCYRFFLRSGMKSANHKGERGFKPLGAVSGFEIYNEHIENAEGRVIDLNSSFSDMKTNLNHRLIAYNSHCYPRAIVEMKSCLSDAGFEVDHSTWEDYKVWEKEKLRDF